VEALGPTPLKRPELRALVEDGSVAYSRRALLDERLLVQALRRSDSLVHLEYRRPGRTAGEATANVGPTASLMGAARSAGVGYVCFASSSAVYPPGARGVSEDTAVGGAVSEYALAKIMQETCVRAWSRLTGHPAAVLRLATVYGAGETVPRAIPNFIRAALSGRPPVVNGRGTEAFDPIHVDDVADAFVRAVTQRARGTFNIGTGTGRTAREVAELVIRLCGARCEVVENRATQARAGAICDVTRASSVLGFRARVQFVSGLRDEIAWLEAAVRDARIAV